MTEDTIHEPAAAAANFPPAPADPRISPAPVKKKAAKKTAKKAVDKPKAAKKAPAKKSSKNGAAPEAVQADPAPVAAPPVVESKPAPAEVPAPVSAPVAQVEQSPAPAPRPSLPPTPCANADAPGPAEFAGGNRPQGQHQDRNEHGGRRLNKWEKRKQRWRERQRERDGQQPQNEGGEQQQPPPPVVLGPPEPSEGILEITPKGYGFLRQRSRQWAQFPQDPWVSPEWIRNLGLREGHYIKGIEQMGHRGPQVTQITEVNGLPPEKIRDLPLFEELKAVNPNKRIVLETRADRLTTRVMDLITPVGRGQRGLIVAPPRAGKTTLLEHIAEAIMQNHPQMHLMMLLVDERPEEVTEFRRALPNAEIHASSNDSDIKSHVRTACFAIERAKRLVESGHHVFILLDSITRMGRAFNNAQKSGGAIMSGGVGVGALEMPRRLFAAARNTRDAGSLTILATTLIETGSRMDELIFQEFKGTGNLELVLDRKIAEQYIYPAVNIFRSGTRREELLLPPFQLEKIHMLRRGLAGHKPIDAIQRVIQLMERSTSNTQMLVDLPGKTVSMA